MLELDDNEAEVFTNIAWPRSGPFIPHAPEPPQQAFLWLDCNDALYGGAAGGGKSDALLMGALQYIDVPGYAALLLRKTYTELNLENALLDRSHKWLAHTGAQWNGEHNRWTFPSGARIYFGYLQHMKDRARYQSAEYQYVGFDELTAFSEGDFRFMFSRVRKPPCCPKVSKPQEHPDHQMDCYACSGTGRLGEANCDLCRGSGRLSKAVPIVGDDGRLQCSVCGADSPPVSAVPLRVRGATNPGGPGHKWVKERYIDPWVAGTPIWGRDGQPNRIFIPAKLSDNPHVDQQGYMAGLEELDPELRQQLLEGDWNAREPGDWMIPDHRWIDAAEEVGWQMWNDGVTPPPDGEIHLGIDWGEHTQGYVIWPLPGGGVYVPPSEVVSEHEDPVATSHKLLQAALRYEYNLVSARYDAAGVQSMRTFVNIARRVPGLDRIRSTGIPFNKYKRESVGYLRTLLRRVYAGETSRIIAIHPDNAELLRQLRSWQRKGPELDEAVKQDDHGPDAILAGIAPIAAQHRDYIERGFQEATRGDNDSAYRAGMEETMDVGIDPDAVFNQWKQAV